MSYIDRGIALATELARDSDCPNFKIGAALLRSNHIVATGKNWFRKSNPQSQTMWHGIHAEFDCLNRADPEKTKNCTLFVVRVTSGDRISMAKPCGVCATLIQKHGVRVVYYTDYGGNVVREKVP